VSVRDRWRLGDVERLAVRAAEGAIVQMMLVRASSFMLRAGSVGWTMKMFCSATMRPTGVKSLNGS
jgi:hypothetical protein